MPKLIYAPKALDDLQGIKTYVVRQFEVSYEDTLEMIENHR